MSHGTHFNASPAPGGCVTVPPTTDGYVIVDDFLAAKHADRAADAFYTWRLNHPDITHLVNKFPEVDAGDPVIWDYVSNVLLRGRSRVWSWSDSQSYSLNTTWATVSSTSGTTVQYYCALGDGSMRVPIGPASTQFNRSAI